MKSFVIVATKGRAYNFSLYWTFSSVKRHQPNSRLLLAQMQQTSRASRRTL
jgi:hypothetical protein